MAYDYAYMEGYELQPTKSVVLNISHKQRKQESNNLTFTIGPNKMPPVESSEPLHSKETWQQMWKKIFKKARRSAYSLLGGEFHGHNGLDVETIVHW